MSTTTSMATMANGPGWDSTVWDTINKAVHDETQRSKIAQQILPINGPLGPNVSYVPSDITEKDKNGNGLRISEGDPTNLIETTVKFMMTKAQVQQEKTLWTGMTLATKAANVLSQAQDQLIFQGSEAKFNESIQGVIEVESNGNDSKGLLGGKDDPREVVKVEPVGGPAGEVARYGENTFKKVAEGIARLQNLGHYGSYALVLNFEQYADTFAPLKDTLVMPVDRIRPLVDKGFYGSGTLPSKKGLLFSLAGDTMDLTVGTDAQAEYTTPDGSMLYRFRVYERFALRLKDKTAVIRLEFQ